MNLNWIKEIFTKDNVMSSKRIFGGLGFTVCMGVLIYCTCHVIQAPTFADIMLISCMSLLGVDSITDIWKGNKKEIKDEEVDS